MLCVRTLFSIILLSVTLNADAATPKKVRAAQTVTLKASWYGKQFHGRKMANGKPFNMYDEHTVAHKSWKFGTVILATNIANGRTCRAVVRDRGPYISGRSLDFSFAGAQCLGFEKRGVATVRVRVIK